MLGCVNTSAQSIFDRINRGLDGIGEDLEEASYLESTIFTIAESLNEVIELPDEAEDIRGPVSLELRNILNDLGESWMALQKQDDSGIDPYHFYAYRDSISRVTGFFSGRRIRDNLSNICTLYPFLKVCPCGIDPDLDECQQ